MAHVVTSRCFGCKYTDCVVECPTDAFREGEQMLYIDPEACICCDQCVPACPVEAIYCRGRRARGGAKVHRLECGNGGCLSANL